MTDVRAGQGAPHWIEFLVEGTSPSGITSIFTVAPKQGGGALGTVRWYAPWRKYAFFPRPDTLYEQDCLRDIATFCENETAAQRKRRAARVTHV